jgi:hypothetical protein
MFNRVVKDAKAPHDPQAAEKGFFLGLDRILDGIEVRMIGAGASRAKATVARQRGKLRPD